MTKKKIERRPRGRPKGSHDIIPRKTDKKGILKNPLNAMILRLRELERAGKIKSLSEQHHLINTPLEYVYISFKMPKSEINKNNNNQ